MQVEFDTFIPSIPSYNYMYMLEAMTYRTTIRVQSDQNSFNPSSSIAVQAWTNQYDKDNSNGAWHAIDLPYTGTSDNHYHHFGQSVIITSDRDFQFTFRFKLSGDDEFHWSHNYGVNGKVHVEGPRLHDAWTLGPNYTQILDNVHIGNFIAATNAGECGFTHVLNVADNLDMVYPNGDVVYHKIAMRDGAHNPISRREMEEAVRWLQQYNTPSNKLLVNCRAGIGRAGSVGVGFVFASDPTISYEDAYRFVYGKRFVYPHAGLREMLYQLFPRTQ